MKSFVLIVAMAVLLCGDLSGQYYNTGQAPARQKWDQIRTDSLKIIYPRGFEDEARRILFYMETARSHVNHGFRHRPLKTPVVLNTLNFFSNGLAILAPKRIEMVGIPSINSYSNPWLKQLATHEYRHMVQYANINRSTVKVLSYIFGQQVSLLATGLLPFWFIEGDAVMAETQFSEFGRGLQPSYTMHYRAMGRELLRRRNPDKWFSGSYREYVPSHYELGFQLVAHAERTYGEYIWDDIARYSSNYPFLLFTTQIGLWKYRRTSTRRLFHDTFAYLNDWWDSLPPRENSAKVLTGAVRTHTEYEYPLFLEDGRILVLKTDYDRPQRFVVVDPADGSERHLCHTGVVSTRPVLGGGNVWWTEYRQSMFWQQETGSVLCSMEVGQWKPTTHSVDQPVVQGEKGWEDEQIGHGKNRQQAVRGDWQAVLYPTPVPEGGVAFVEYNSSGYYSIIRDRFAYDFPRGVSIHGLAWDDVTDKLYFIALSDSGMWIGGLTIEINRFEAQQVTKPAKVTLKDLSAQGGKLYFGSVLSGYDEAHMYDLASGHQYLLTTSKYGSFSPSPSSDGRRAALTVYDRDGYKLAVQSIDSPTEIAASHLPENKVNPPIVDWELSKIDSAVFGQMELKASKETKPSKRYHKGLHLFNFHSWLPLDAVPENFIAGEFNVNYGVTLISQNTLSTALSNFAYGYTREGKSLVRGTFKYLGWAPKIEIDALWSNSPQRIYKTVINQPPPEKLSDHITVSGRVYLPMLLTSGYRIRSLTGSVQYLYRNALWYDYPGKRYTTGDHQIAGSIAYTDYVRRARLDLQPRWGYLLRATVVGDPRGRIGALTGSLYGRIYLPGFFRHHAISLAAGYQNKFGKGARSYYVMDVLPRGLENFGPKSYAALSANYSLPIAYPDWGLSGIFFLKRIYMNVGLDYAHYTKEIRYVDGTSEFTPGSAYSWGGTVNFDFAPFRLPAEGTCTLSVSAYFPSDTRKPFISAGFSVPL